jgi:putative intracellular protease/amidase
MWDLAEDPHYIALIEAFYSSGKPVAAVCHAPGVLHRVKFQGQPIVKGKRLTGFTNGTGFSRGRSAAARLVIIHDRLTVDRAIHPLHFIGHRHASGSGYCFQRSTLGGK